MTLADAPRYSVAIPCYNERANVIPLLTEIDALLGARRDVEIVVVDDCSTDGTREEIPRARAVLRLPIRAIAHSCNRGQSAALCTAIDAARGEWIVTLDGDGQNDPRDIVELLTRLEQRHFPADVAMICGHRRERRDTWIRRVSSRIANRVRARLLADATPDTGCGLKLIRREAFVQLPRFDHMHRFLPALVQRAGARVISVAVRHRPRIHGASKYGVHNRLWAGIVDLAGVMWLRRRAFRASHNEEL